MKYGTLTLLGTEIDQFALEYQVAGNIYWDNNSGYDYRLDTSAAHTDGIGTVVINPNVLVVAVDILAGILKALILVKNIQFAKTVGIVYTTDTWTTFHTALASYQRNYPPPKQPHQADAELWEVNVPLGAGANGSFAAYTPSTAPRIGTTTSLSIIPFRDTRQRLGDRSPEQASG